jgi:hypothetical protein
MHLQAALPLVQLARNQTCKHMPGEQQFRCSATTAQFMHLLAALPLVQLARHEPCRNTCQGSSSALFSNNCSSHVHAALPLVQLACH